MNRALMTVGVSMWACAALCAPHCAAEPVNPSDPQPVPAVPAQTATAPSPQEQAAPSGGSVADACKLFNVALDVAAVNYEDFAYATAGNGNLVDYRDPEVGRSNVAGRTALRQAAAAAMSAAGTPGLPVEVSNPMRAWSLRATKLLVVMGLHGGGDSLNSNVAGLNSEANDAQMACALATRQA